MIAGTICLPINCLPWFACYVASFVSTVIDVTFSALFALEDELESAGPKAYISNRAINLLYFPSTTIVMSMLCLSRFTCSFDSDHQLVQQSRTWGQKVERRASRKGKIGVMQMSGQDSGFKEHRVFISNSPKHQNTNNQIVQNKIWRKVPTAPLIKKPLLSRFRSAPMLPTAKPSPS